MLIAIRSDSAPTMGVGHVTRCLALAAALKEAGAEILLLTRDLGVDVTPLARNSGVDAVMLPRPDGQVETDAAVPYASWALVSWQTDAAQCNALLKRRRPDWVVVDHYAFDERWHREIASSSEARIAVIDDLGDRMIDADVLVDQNPSSDHAAKFAGRLARSCRLLGGPRYALLGPSYRRVPPIEVKGDVGSIGIFLGGTDPADLSPVALRACREQAGFAGLIEIVTTRSNPNFEQLAHLVSKWPHTRLLLDLPDLAQFFAAHDLQIGAGGGASWERCCVGVPTLAMTAADNQSAVLPELAKREAALVLDQTASRDVLSVGSAVRALLENGEMRARLASNSRALVDGIGAVRVALALCRDELQIRAARVGDSQLIHAWRNHPATRNVSRNSAETALSDHERWLRRVLRDDNCGLLIAHIGRIDVGVVRFDRKGGDEAEVSIYLDPALYGLGLGSNALLAAEQYVTRRWAIRQVVAEVLETNHASQRLFASSGYRWSGQLWRKCLDTTQSRKDDDENR